MKRLIVILFLSLQYVGPAHSSSSLPSITHLDSTMQKSLRYACSSAEYLGPQAYIDCYERQLAKFGTQKKIKKIRETRENPET